MITVFTSSYNHGQYLQEAIDSVLNQSYSDFEYILIDDGSTDQSAEIMLSIKDPRVRVIILPKQRNTGSVLNESIKQMRGTHWTWCPADDMWSPNLLKLKVEAAESLPQNAVIYNDYYIMDAEGHLIEVSNLKELTPETFKEKVWKTSPIGFTGIWIPVSVLEEIPFPEHITYSEDFFWMIKATIHNVPFYHLKKRLHYKRKHNESVTQKNYSSVIADIPKIRAQLAAYKDQYDT